MDAAAAGRPMRGLRLACPAPAVVEVGCARLDFVFTDGEHACLGWRDVAMACVTAERHGPPPIAGIAGIVGTSRATRTRCLDRGLPRLVVPHVESEDDAPGAGARGVPPPSA